MPTRIRVDRDIGGRPRVALRAGELAPRVLHRDGAGVRIALVATVALLLAGDDVVIEVEVADGVHVEIVETSATVAYDMRGGAARWRVRARVAVGGTLVWSGLPFVVSDGADVERVSTVELGAGAVALLRETVVLGRHGQAGGELLLRFTVTGVAGAPLLREDLDLRAAHRDDPVVLGGARVLDTVTLLGAVPDGPLDAPAGAEVLELAATGTVVRALCDAVHRSGLDPVARQLSSAVMRR